MEKSHVGSFLFLLAIRTLSRAAVSAEFATCFAFEIFHSRSCCFFMPRARMEPIDPLLVLGETIEILYLTLGDHVFTRPHVISPLSRRPRIKLSHWLGVVGISPTVLSAIRSII